MARYKSWSANPVGDYSKRLAKKRRKSSGCYVATCVYGSYDCPEVWVLRRFRDGTLEKSILGRAFISFYYIISPMVVKCFGHMYPFKKMCETILNSIVCKLQSMGYENSPYDDLY